MKKKRRKNFALKKETCQQKPQQSWRVENRNNFSCVWGLSGVPDVAQGSDITPDGVPEESNKEGLFASTYFQVSQAVGGSNGIKYLRLCHKLTDNLMVKWETVLLDKRLYVHVPNNILVQGSRDSLVALLDTAEEHLGCDKVILFFRRNRLERGSLIKTFQFMGFMPIPPGHPHIPNEVEYFFMACEVG